MKDGAHPSPFAALSFPNSKKVYPFSAGLTERVFQIYCNQLFLQFSMDHFEIMHTCCGYIEDVQVDFSRSKNNVDKITAFST